MRNEVIQLLLENNDVASFGETDTLALKVFLQRENAYDHARTLSFPMICIHRPDDPSNPTASPYGLSYNDKELIRMRSELRELQLNLTCIRLCRTKEEFINLLSLGEFLSNQTVLTISLELQSPRLWSVDISVEGAILEHGEEVARWLQDEFELRQPGEVKVNATKVDNYHHRLSFATTFNKGYAF